MRVVWRHSTLARMWVLGGHGTRAVFAGGLRYGLRPPERVPLSTLFCNNGRNRGGVGEAREGSTLGITELACGSQAFIATLLFDPSMSALPIIPKQNSVSVGLFTH